MRSIFEHETGRAEVEAEPALLERAYDRDDQRKNRTQADGTRRNTRGENNEGTGLLQKPRRDGPGKHRPNQHERADEASQLYRSPRNAPEEGHPK
jgi:hypothetical protein